MDVKRKISKSHICPPCKNRFETYFRCEDVYDGFEGWVVFLVSQKTFMPCNRMTINHDVCEYLKRIIFLLFYFFSGQRLRCGVLFSENESDRYVPWQYKNVYSQFTLILSQFTLKNDCDRSCVLTIILQLNVRIAVAVSTYSI